MSNFRSSLFIFYYPGVAILSNSFIAIIMRTINCTYMLAAIPRLRTTDCLNSQSTLSISSVDTFNYKSFFNKFYRLYTPAWGFILFKGKSFRMKFFSKSGKVLFYFNRSHWTRAILLKEYFIIKKFKRQRYFFITKDSYTAKKLYHLLISVRGWNKYTGRGLRFSQQVLRKRFGKISQAFTGLH